MLGYELLDYPSYYSNIHVMLIIWTLRNVVCLFVCVGGVSMNAVGNSINMSLILCKLIDSSYTRRIHTAVAAIAA